VAELGDELLALRCDRLVALSTSESASRVSGTARITSPVWSSSWYVKPFWKQQRLHFSPEPQGHRSFREKGFVPISRAVFRPTPQVVWEVVWGFLPIA
jgi:hypothetical protein